jgi:uncharacterized membrane protein
MQDAEHYLLRWQSAGLLDDSTASSIRAYEQGQVKPAGRQWQVLLALILGGILLGAGVLLFVAAHWDQVSPISRLLLVLFMLVFFHGLGILVRERFSGLATAMHAIGTVSAGAAIALVGQIFNMQEHWPSAVMLWALCAASGWALLRDQFQQTLTFLLIPAWIICEWCDRTFDYGGADVYLARVLAVVGAAYLVSFLNSRKKIVFGILFGAGAILLATSVRILAEGWRPTFQLGWGFIPLRYRIFALLLVAVTALFAFGRNRKGALPVVIVGLVAYALPWLQTSITETSFRGDPWTHSEPSLMAYVLVAATSVFFVWWGVHTSSKSLVNFGMVAFAITVFWFYFSNIMDKLGRSLGLMLLGVLFLAGGWFLETTRRKLVRAIAGGAQ